MVPGGVGGGILLGWRWHIVKIGIHLATSVATVVLRGKLSSAMMEIFDIFDGKSQKFEAFNWLLHTGWRMLKITFSVSRIVKEVVGCQIIIGCKIGKKS